MALTERQIEIVLTGSLDTKEHAEAEDAQGFRELLGYRYGGQLGRLERTPWVSFAANTSVIAGQGLTTDRRPHTLFKRGAEALVLTNHHGAQRYIPNVATLQPMRALTRIDPPAYDAVSMVMAPAEVSRTVVRSAFQSRQNAAVIACAGAPTYGGEAFVVGWIEYGPRPQLFVRAYGIVNGAEVDFATRVEDLGADPTGGRAYCISAAPYGTDPGAVVTVSQSPGGAPYPIFALHYRSSTRSWIGTTVLATAAHPYHAIYADGLVLRLGYQDAGTGFFRVETRTLGAVSATYNTVRTIALPPSFARNDSNGHVAVFSIPGGLGTLHVDDLNAGAGFLVATAGAGELYLSVSAAWRGAAADVADVFVSTSNTAGVDPSAYSVGYLQTTWTTGVSAAGMAYVHNCFVAARSVAHEERVYTGFSDQFAPALGSMLLARTVRAPNATHRLVDPVARCAHDRQQAFPDLIYPAMSALWVMGGVLYALVLADIADDDQDNVFYDAQTLMLCKVKLTRAAAPCDWTESAGTTLIASGLLYDYDGALTSEAQPLTRPVVVSGGGIPTTTQYACAIYSWTDDAGKLHRSAPSSVIAIEVGHDAFVTVPPFTAHDGVTSHEIATHLYLSADGIDFYLANDASGQAHEYDRMSLTGSHFVFQATQAADNTAAPLYTNGGELESEAPPAFLTIVKVGDRLFAIDAEDRTRWWCTKPLVAGYAPEWNTALTGIAPDEMVSIRDVNGTPVLLCKDGIFQLPGAGPNAFGQGTYAPPVKLSHLGCVSKNSVCDTPRGIVFQSQRGFVLLNGGYQIEEIGLPVSRLTSPDVFVPQRVVYDVTRDELRTHDVTGQLRYFYCFANGAWSRATTAPYAYWDSMMLEREALIVAGGPSDGAGFIGVEQTAGLSTAAQEFQTPWIKIDGIAGYGRLWRAILALRSPATGAVTAGCTIVVSLYVDYNDATADSTFTFDATQLVSWGLDEVHDLVLYPKKQRCQAIKVKCRITQSVDNSGFIPLSLRLKCGVDPQAARSQRSYNRKGAA